MTIDFDSFTPDALRRHPTEKWCEPDVIGAGGGDGLRRRARGGGGGTHGQVDAGALAYPTPRQEEAPRGAACAGWFGAHHRLGDLPRQGAPHGGRPDRLTLVLDHLAPAARRVVLPVPNYMPFLSLPELFGHPVLRVPGITDAAGRYTMDLDGIDAAFRAGGRLLIPLQPPQPGGTRLRPRRTAGAGRRRGRQRRARVQRRDPRATRARLHPPARPLRRRRRRDRRATRSRRRRSRRAGTSPASSAPS